MTVSVQDQPIRYGGNGVATKFAGPYAQRADDVRVIYLNGDGITVTELDGNSDYSVSGLFSSTGTTVTITASEFVPDRGGDGSEIVVYSNAPNTQERGYPSGGAFPQEEIGFALDKLTVLVQQVEAATERALRRSIGDTDTNLVLPPVVNRAGNLLSFSSSGAPVALDPQTLIDQINTPDPDDVDDRGVRIVTAADLGLAGDGTTDDGPKLHRELQKLAAAGGGAVYLKALAGSGFRINGVVSIPSYVSLTMGSPFRFGSQGSIKIEGRIMETPRDATPDLHAAGFTLISDALSGTAVLTVDTSPVGGGVLSSTFVVGDRLVVYGLVDGAGRPTQKHETSVTAIDDGARQLTIATPLPFTALTAYPSGAFETEFGVANRTLVRLQNTVPITSDVAPGDATVTVAVAQLTRLVIGSHIGVRDTRLASSVAGASTEEIRFEMARVVDISGTIVTLDRRLARDYLVASGAEVLVIDVVERASLNGMSAEFVQVAANNPRVHTFEMRYAYLCEFNDGSVPNEDSFGSRGNAFRVWRSRECAVIDCSASSPKFFDGGEGYGLSFYYSTACEARSPNMVGCRNGLLFQGSTNCFSAGGYIADSLNHDIDFHGCHEFGCTVSGVTLEHAARIVGGANTAISFGNTFHLAGTHLCGVSDVTVTMHDGTNPKVVRFDPPSTQCFLRGINVNGCDEFLFHRDIAGEGSLISRDHTISDVTINNPKSFVINVDGGANGAAGRTLDGVTFSNLVIRGGSKFMLLTQAANFRLLGLRIFEVTIDPANKYFLLADDVTGFVLRDAIVQGASRGIRFTNCPGFIVSRGDFVDFDEDVVFQDQGGNAGYVWVNNTPIGFDWTADRTGGSIGDESPAIIPTA